jgi:hypothetical protein
MFAVVAALSFLSWIGIIVLWAIFLFVTFILARHRGRHAIFWVILACFLPLITIIALLILPDRSRRR